MSMERASACRDCGAWARRVVARASATVVTRPRVPPPYVHRHPLSDVHELLGVVVRHMGVTEGAMVVEADKLGLVVRGGYVTRGIVQTMAGSVAWEKTTRGDGSVHLHLGLEHFLMSSREPVHRALQDIGVSAACAGGKPIDVRVAIGGVAHTVRYAHSHMIQSLRHAVRVAAGISPEAVDSRGVIERLERRVSNGKVEPERVKVLGELAEALSWAAVRRGGGRSERLAAVRRAVGVLRNGQNVDDAELLGFVERVAGVLGRA